MVVVLLKFFVYFVKYKCSPFFIVSFFKKEKKNYVVAKYAYIGKRKK